MNVHIVKLCRWKIPRRFIHLWMENLERELVQGLQLKDREITIAFLEKSSMKKLNRDFRSKNKVTDILSFSGSEPEELGELALCGPVIEKQARDHQISVREELGYLLIHGVLHLLGHEHEKSRKKAKIMFELQDRLFERMRKVNARTVKKM